MPVIVMVSTVVVRSGRVDEAGDQRHRARWMFDRDRGRATGARSGDVQQPGFDCGGYVRGWRGSLRIPD
jgi:hypothetical protein